jgi:tetrahydromethanopterin S-methyltransferase subunit B
MDRFAIIMYLNQKPYEPRERDYAYAGSFYAYCIWIGLSVLAIFEFVKIHFKNIAR